MIPINIILITLLELDVFGVLPAYWNSIYVFYVFVVFNTSFLALRINHLSEYEREQDFTVFYSKYLFLLGLIILTINQFLKRQIVIDYINYIIAITIAFGFLAFLASKNRIKKEIKDEKENQEIAEERRKNEFDSMFPKIAKLNLRYGFNYATQIKSFPLFLLATFLCPFIFLLRLPYKLIKWMYKEGWSFSIPFVIILIIFIAIKIAMPILYTGSYIDEYYHISSGIEFFKTGHFAEIYPGEFYYRGAYVSFLVGLFFKLFGQTIFVAKMLPAFVGIINFFLLFTISRKIILRKIYVLFLLTIYSISPWIILNHFYIRFYIFYEFFLLINIYLFIQLIDSLNDPTNHRSIKNILILVLINILGYLLSNDLGFYMILLFLLSVSGYNYLFNLKNVTKCRNNKFILVLLNLKIKYKLIALVSLTIFFSFIFDIKSKMIYFVSVGNLNPLFPPNKFSYVNFFFIDNLIFTIFFLIGVIFLFVQIKVENEDYSWLWFGVFILWIFHMISSSELQTLRTIFYFMPIFYLFGVLMISKIKAHRIYKLIILSLLLISVYSAYPLDFSYNPSQPGGAAYFGGEIYSDVRSLCQDKIIISSYGPDVLSFYGIKADYIIQNRGYEGSSYLSRDNITNAYYYPYPVKTRVIISLDELKKLYNSNKKICYVERSLVNDAYVEKDIQGFIKDNFQLYPKTYFREKLFVK